MTRHSSHTSIQAHAEANCLGTDARKKEGLTKPDYLRRPFTSLDHHLGGKSLVVVEFYIEPIGRGGVVV
jgi:hypothetical protein